MGDTFQGLERFLREIELAAVFDSGVVDEATTSMPYFVMPYVEGETLRR